MTHSNMKSPTILAIDSTSGSCSVSIWKNNAISTYCEELLASLQAKRLIQMVEEALDESKTQYGDLSAIACTIGPGSFTGIRIGLASARAIGFAAKIPVLGFNSLEVMAFGARLQKPDAAILAILNAGKGEAIYQRFNANFEALCPPTLVAQHLAPAQDSSITITFPRADFLAKLAATHPERAVAPLPFYVRPPDAKLPQNNKNKSNVATQ